MYSKNNVFNQINVTPLTDVFLVLLVVMILVSPNMQRYVLKIDPPRDNCNIPCKFPDNERNLLKLRLHADGKLSLGTQLFPNWSSVSLQNEIESRQNKLGTKDFPVLISSSLETKQKDLVAVLDAVVGAKIKRVQIEKPSNIEPQLD